MKKNDKYTWAFLILSLVLLIYFVFNAIDIHDKGLIIQDCLDDMHMTSINCSEYIPIDQIEEFRERFNMPLNLTRYNETQKYIK